MFLLHPQDVGFAAIRNVFDGGVSESPVPFKSPHIDVCCPDGGQSRGKALSCVLHYSNAVLGGKPCLWLLGNGSGPEGGGDFDPLALHVVEVSLKPLVCWALLDPHPICMLQFPRRKGYLARKVERWRNQHNYIFLR